MLHTQHNQFIAKHKQFGQFANEFLLGLFSASFHFLWQNTSKNGDKYLFWK